MNTKEVSPLAALAYGILRDRLQLSLKNPEQFSDNKGAFVYFTMESLGEYLQMSVPSARKIMTELKNNSLVFIKRQGLGKPNKIYFQTERVFRSRVKDSFNQDSKDFSGIKTEYSKTDTNKNESVLEDPHPISPLQYKKLDDIMLAYHVYTDYNLTHSQKMLIGQMFDYVDPDEVLEIVRVLYNVSKPFAYLMQSLNNLREERRLESKHLAHERMQGRYNDRNSNT